ncbi:pyrrolo-quinoline quinone [Acidobacteria bacterium AB60]|nr:pyrrolo-quinoline quinone [Acidobacteria bacterium AB60]
MRIRVLPPAWLTSFGAILCCGISVGAPAQIPTAQVDNARTGAYLHEVTLSPQNVNAQQFGKLFSLKVDGDVYAQPLFVPGVDIPGQGKHDVLYIATEHDSVYAFDAYGTPSTPLWRVSLRPPGTTTLTENDVNCFFIRPEVGITSTPVIDLRTGTLFVLARTKNSRLIATNEYRQQLHALAITNGVEKFGGPVEIKASVNGRGDGSTGGKLAFDALRENPRAALLLSNGLVYLSWASSCDVDPYHGWIMAYDARTLKQKAVFNVSPDADDGGIWASDTGIAADADGNVYAATGNGRFDAAQGGHDYGDTLLKLHMENAGLAVRDYFTPSNQQHLNSTDSDLGSGGPVLLPDQPGPHRHLAIIGGKAPLLYVIDRDHMGHFDPGSDKNAVQTISTNGGIFGAVAYWNQHVYLLNEGDRLQEYRLVGGKLVFKAAATFSLRDHAATPAVSANGSKDGIVWVVSSKGWNSPDRTAVLHAVDASNVAHELYNSQQNARRDHAGLALRFNIPTVVNGHVYIGAKHEVDVYGLLSTGP